ncbi:MAG TPA: hypothetical protein DCM05_01625, partial [Elusimicrobia bacterium]|nr:hypothetical protein [Elusimicrobiota bacterium]
MSDRGIRGFPRDLAGIVAGAALVLALGGYLFYRHEARAIRAEKYAELKAIAELKAGSLAIWQQERLSDVRLNASGYIKQLVGQWLRSPGSASLKESLLARLREFRDLEGYQNMIVADPDGRVR